MLQFCSSSVHSSMAPTLISINLSLSHVLFFLLTAIPFSSGKLLHLRFYQVHIGPDAHEVFIASPNKTSSAAFGTVAVVDDPLREGPEPTSKLIGRVQGIIAQASQGSPAVLVVQNFVFSDGEYNGGTLAALGRATLTSEREYNIVGGSGVFRLASGYALGNVVSLSATGFSLKFDAYFEHL